MQGYIYIFVCGDFFIYPIGDVEYLVKHWTDFSKLCLILIMRSYDNTIKPYSSNIYISIILDKTTSNYDGVFDPFLKIDLQGAEFINLWTPDICGPLKFAEGGLSIRDITKSALTITKLPFNLKVLFD